jgi:hypothetical protein
METLMAQREDVQFTSGDDRPNPVLRVRNRLGGTCSPHAALCVAIYIDAFEHVVADQLAFLDKHLNPASG